MTTAAAISHFLGERVPYTERDNRAWGLAVLLRKHNVPLEEALAAGYRLHAQMEQPPSAPDYIPVEAVLEKIHRLYATDHVPRISVEDETQPTKFTAFPLALPDTEGCSLKEAALRWQEKGYSIIPLDRQAKRPLIKWKEYQSRRPTREEVEQWWTWWPEANIALVTGALNEIIVLDFDVREGFEGHPLSEKWLVETPVVRTNRGMHVYLRCVSPVASHRYGQVDLKAEGAYVLVPPSIHPSGTVYRRIDQAGEWVLDLVAGASRYCREAVQKMAPPPLPLISRQTYQALPEAVRQHPGAEDEWATEVQVCGMETLALGDKNSHRMLVRKSCRQKGCPRDARGEAWRWLDKHRERLASWPSCTAILGIYRPGLSAEEARKAAGKARRLLRQEGWQGDSFYIPCLREDGEVAYALLFAGHGKDHKSLRSLLALEGAEVYVSAIGKENIEEFLFNVLWTVRAGVNLWPDPGAFHFWRKLEGGGMKSVSGIDIPTETTADGKTRKKPRRGVARDHRLPPRRCPICGEEMKPMVRASALTWRDCLTLVETGKAKLVGQDAVLLLEAKRPRASATVGMLPMLGPPVSP